jgi:tetratricopeptide (TPR) repeat protein
VAIQRGHRAFLAQDFDLALASYREAAMGTPPVPAAHYFIACALRSKGDLDGAIESFRTAARLTNDSDPAVKAKALFNIAVTLQVLRRLPQARETWLEYQAWVRANASIVGFPDVAEQNIAVIDAWSQLEERVGEVRRRIADRAAQAAQPAE